MARVPFACEIRSKSKPISYNRVLKHTLLIRVEIIIHMFSQRLCTQVSSPLFLKQRLWVTTKCIEVIYYTVLKCNDDKLQG